MKVLVLQLARLGDIFQTWPTLHALKASGAEVHILVRPRFAAAAKSCAAVEKIHSFDTEAILTPILSHPIEGLRPSMEEIDALMFSLDSEKFDRVINLSFSPLSSWIAFDLEHRARSRCHAISVRGYTRHDDGTLSIPDDASAYFFAQVGYRAQVASTEIVNRLSLPRLFATIAEVDPVEADWHGPTSVKSEKSRIALPETFVAVHVGASSETKTLDSRHWGDVVARIVRRSGLSVVLLGASGELEKANEILKSVESHGISLNPENAPTRRVFSLVGQTSIDDLFGIVAQCEVLVAGDSALVHVASLVGTQVLNLSSRSVSHWETGPTSRGSRIICYGGAAPATESIVRELMLMLAPSILGSMADRIVKGPLEEICETTTDHLTDFSWSLISAIYLGTPLPQALDRRMREALNSWIEVCGIERHQLQALKSGVGDSRQISSVLDRVDELARMIVGADPRLAAIERWWSTEKVRMAPASKENLIEMNNVLNDRLNSVLQGMNQIEEQRDGHQLDI